METVKTEVQIDSDIQEFVPRFCQSRKSDLENLSKQLASGDFTGIAKIAHVIKGVSRPYGFPTLEKLAVDLEKAALANDSATCASMYQKMNDYLKKYTIN
ncbi:MAG: Hpt domain-containing protein [Bdellovibrio sp.]|nr:Hpt domain-containing protein [Bdellovibrio sp.]